MKVKEYRFHIPICHIFWELLFVELPECIAVSKLPGLDPVSGSAMAAPFIRSFVPVVSHLRISLQAAPSADASKRRDQDRAPESVARYRSEARGFTRLLHTVESVDRAIPTSDGNVQMPSGHSRRTTELGRVEWNLALEQLQQEKKHIGRLYLWIEIRVGIFQGWFGSVYRLGFFSPLNYMVSGSWLVHWREEMESCFLTVDFAVSPATDIRNHGTTRSGCLAYFDHSFCRASLLYMMITENMSLTRFFWRINFVGKRFETASYDVMLGYIVFIRPRALKSQHGAISRFGYSISHSTPIGRPYPTQSGCWAKISQSGGSAWLFDARAHRTCRTV
jgi:hypothetical protein